jgi:hypothetical protein
VKDILLHRVGIVDALHQLRVELFRPHRPPP